MFLLKKFELTKYHLLKRRTRTPCDKKTICDVRKQKNDVKNTTPETIRNEKNSVIKKEQNSKKCRLRFYGAIRKAV